MSTDSIVNCIFSNNTTLAGHVTVGDYVIISGLTAVHQFCSIGNHAFVTGGSLVRKDVPPYIKAAREPLSYVGINSVGLRRRGFESDKIREIQNIYRLLYQKNYNNSQAYAIIEAEMEASNERDEILMFIKNSHRYNHFTIKGTTLFILNISSIHWHNFIICDVVNFKASI